jgi:YidC/Oxa1 family membrane protein insertase
LLRILQQYYITKKFYGGDESLGRQAQRAGEAAKEEAKKSGEPTGMLAQAKRDLSGPKGDDKDKTDKNAKSGNKNGKNAKNGKGDAPKPTPVTNKRVTPSKNRPTPSGNGKGRPTPTRREVEAARSQKSARPKSPNKKKR